VRIAEELRVSGPVPAKQTYRETAGAPEPTLSLSKGPAFETWETTDPNLLPSRRRRSVDEPRTAPGENLRFEPKPAAHRRLHHRELFQIQLAQPAYELGPRNRDKILRVESAVALSKKSGVSF